MRRGHVPERIPARTRLATHFDVSAAAIDRAVAAFRAFFAR